MMDDTRILYLTLEDNGKGMDLTDKSIIRFGLNNIEARINMLGGTVSFDSQPGKGMITMINIPYG